MIAVPLVSLVALYAFSAILTVPSAISEHNYTTSTSAESSPAVTALSVQLPQERALTYVWLASGRKGSDASLLATRKAVSQALPAAIGAFRVDENLLSASTKTRLNAFVAALGQINGIRAKADAGQLTPAAAFSDYSNVLDAQFAYYDTSIQERGGGEGVTSVGALDADYSLEMAGREDALVGGTFAAGGKAMSPAVRELFIRSAASRSQLLNETTSLLTGNLVAGYNSFAQSSTYRQFEAMETAIAGSTGAMPVSPTSYQTVTTAYLNQMASIQEANAGRLSAIGSSASSRLTTEAVLAGGVGLAAVIISVLVMLWFGRRVTRDLSGLYSSVRGMAEERLPRVVDRLRRGDDVDVAAESPTPPGSEIQEVDQIAQSFGIVQEAAVSAAVEQARLRKGVNQVFLNISMRNQSLLHRQLGLLDTMERRTSDPGALADLFRLDHLTTRMRRHAEGLIILSGSTPGRGWRDPVPVVDVLRAAVAEVEDYVRVDVVSESRDLVAGGAVNDIIHLVAELVENAAVFSPPNTRIEVRADRAGTGLVAEIEDRGLGLGEEELAEINLRLSRPPEFDPSNSEQLGLFVVSRLAARHQIKVSLRQSVYGGTTAILVVPFGVIVREEDAGALSPVAPGANGSANPPGEQDRAITGPAAALGLAGRHRLAAAATGRRANTGLTDPDAEPDRPPALPRPPWEYGGPEPTAPPATEPLAALPAEQTWPTPPAEPDRPVPQVRAADRPPWDTGRSTPWPDAFSRPPAPSADTFSQPAAPSADTFSQPAAPSANHLGMPVRVPQASLAPQLLRARREQDQGAAGGREPKVDDRTPDATRNMMILMQKGWEHGRRDNLDEPAGAPDHRTER